MPRVRLAMASAALVSIAGLVQADGHGINDQRSNSGQPVAHTALSANPLAGCPVELRGIYRGNLFCRQPLLAVSAPRDPMCPVGARGMYRGALYCLTGEN